MPSILVVEDDELQRRLLKAQLQELGYTVKEASNGNEALRIHRTEPVQIVLTDVLMPDKDGLETIQEFQKDYPDVPIVAMSGGSSLTTVSFLPLAKVLGAVSVLSKPFSLAELADALRAALRVPPGSDREPG